MNKEINEKIIELLADEEEIQVVLVVIGALLYIITAISLSVTVGSLVAGIVGWLFFVAMVVLGVYGFLSLMAISSLLAERKRSKQ